MVITRNAVPGKTLARFAACALCSATLAWLAPSAVAAQTPTRVMRAAPAPATAAVDMYIKFDGLDGEASDKGHEGWIELLSVSQGLPSPDAVANHNTTSSRRSMAPQQVTVTKGYDASSPKLQEACANGTHIPSVVLEVPRRSAGERDTYYRYKLENVRITSYSLNADGADAKAMETVTFNFTKITSTEAPERTR